jgi:hypothetical protein
MSWTAMSSDITPGPDGIIVKELIAKLAIPLATDLELTLGESKVKGQITKVERLEIYHEAFVALQSAAKGGNILLLDSKLQTLVADCSCQLISEEKIRGLALMLLLSMTFIGKDGSSQLIPAAMVTHLVLHKEIRNQHLALLLVQNSIHCGNLLHRHAGYYYSNRSRSLSSISYIAFYRPLRLDIAAEMGYRFKNDRMAATRYKPLSISRPLRHEPTERTDFDIVGRWNYHLYFTPSEKEWELYQSSSIQFLTFKAGSEIKALLGFRLVKIYYSEAQKSQTAAQLIYLAAANQKASQQAMSLWFRTLLETTEAIAVHGITFRYLEPEDTLHLQNSGLMFLDFYNFRGRHLNADSVVLPYI